MNQKYTEDTLIKTRDEIRAHTIYKTTRFFLRILLIIGVATVLLILFGKLERGLDLEDILLGMVLLCSMIVSDSLARALLDTADCVIQSRHERIIPAERQETDNLQKLPNQDSFDPEAKQKKIVEDPPTTNPSNYS